MEDILASIRRILNEDETPAPGQPAPEAAAAEPAATPPPSQPHDPAVDEVLVLDESMLVPEPEPEPPEKPKPAPVEASPPAEPVPIPVSPAPVGLMTAATETAAANSVGSLLRTLTAGRATQVHRGGPTIEDLVREEVRPLLSAWLDTHLPPMVERLVRAEIERVMGRAAP